MPIIYAVIILSRIYTVTYKLYKKKDFLKNYTGEKEIFPGESSATIQKKRKTLDTAVSFHYPLFVSENRGLCCSWVTNNDPNIMEEELWFE